ncbi:hypothetical protein [Streptomyces johnsoniae]|uniref:Lipoprotein n=1 Tax=Streptomyces johnsoniae TaxID=3075532 RepID=A0ABU2RXZ4_9ACTN|nr:hypothetical protein [Streptomyces sp. DSM 41886]MDT0441613.1 hypothetical protein [Streptomyces sp. DSM 41886]
MAVFVCCAVVGGLGACSGDDSGEADEADDSFAHHFGEPMTADEVCDGALAGGAAESLVFITQDAALGEMTGEYRASLADSARALLEEGQFHHERFCAIFTTASEDSWSVRLDFRFSPSREKGAFPVERHQVPYDAGVRAFVENQAAILSVRCSVEGAAADSDLNGSLSVGEGAVEDPDAMMDVLNTATRAMAEELGCAEEAGLLEEAPQRLDS